LIDYFDAARAMVDVTRETENLCVYKDRFIADFGGPRTRGKR
jgi:hypothetical protein